MAAVVRVTLTIEQGESLTDTVRQVEHLVSSIHALTIDSCEVEGNDKEGWYVTVVAYGNVPAVQYVS